MGGWIRPISSRATEEISLSDRRFEDGSEPELLDVIGRCTPLDGLSCFEDVEQLTLLLFLKMADQLTEPPYNRAPIVPPELGWKALLPLDGVALEDQYRTS